MQIAHSKKFIQYCLAGYACIIIAFTAVLLFLSFSDFVASDFSLLKVLFAEIQAPDGYNWVSLIFYFVLMAHSFHHVMQPSLYARHYLAHGFLCYFFFIVTLGILPRTEMTIREITPLAQFWLIGGVWLQAYFVGIWTGFWDSLDKKVIDGGKILIAFSVFTHVTMVLAVGELSDWMFFLLMFPFILVSFVWVTLYFIELPKDRFLHFVGLGSQVTVFVFLMAHYYLPLKQDIFSGLEHLTMLTSLVVLGGASLLLKLGEVKVIERPNLTSIRQQKAQETEIDQFRSTIEEMTKQHVLMEERDRVVRDVHDGIGGQLTSLLVRLRSGTVEQEEIERDVQDSISDLRLIVDALDTVDGDLVAALATLRARIQPQLDAANISLVWTEDDAVFEKCNFDMRAILNISRFLQEATVNVIRHAEAALLEVHVGFGTSREHLRITLLDDGRGIQDMTTARARGKGMKNMERRAKLLGGSVSMSSRVDKSGHVLSLCIPLLPNERA